MSFTPRVRSIRQQAVHRGGPSRFATPGRPGFGRTEIDIGVDIGVGGPPVAVLAPAPGLYPDQQALQPMVPGIDPSQDQFIDRPPARIPDPNSFFRHDRPAQRPQPVAPTPGNAQTPANAAGPVAQVPPTVPTLNGNPAAIEHDARPGSPIPADLGASENLTIDKTIAEALAAASINPANPQSRVFNDLHLSSEQRNNLLADKPVTLNHKQSEVLRNAFPSYSAVQFLAQANGGNIDQILASAHPPAVAAVPTTTSAAELSDITAGTHSQPAGLGRLGHDAMGAGKSDLHVVEDLAVATVHAIEGAGVAVAHGAEDVGKFLWGHKTATVASAATVTACVLSPPVGLAVGAIGFGATAIAESSGPDKSRAESHRHPDVHDISATTNGAAARNALATGLADPSSRNSMAPVAKQVGELPAPNSSTTSVDPKAPLARPIAPGMNQNFGAATGVVAGIVGSGEHGMSAALAGGGGSPSQGAQNPDLASPGDPSPAAQAARAAQLAGPQQTRTQQPSSPNTPQPGSQGMEIADENG